MPRLAALFLFFALPAFAGELGQRYPTGTISDRAQAEQALRDADAETARLEKETTQREADCHRQFLVNRCRDEVRRDKLTAERELQRVRVEAHDVQRRLDAADRAKNRSAPAERAAKPPRDPKDARTGRAISPEEEARNRAAYEQRLEEKRKAAAEEQARAPEREANARAYREKQAEAERRTKEKEAERKKNEERRAERRRQVEAQEAQREELRRRAEAAGKTLPKQ